MSNKINLTKLLQYFIQAVIIYLIFKYIPTQKMNIFYIILFIITIILLSILLENILNNTNTEPIEKYSNLLCSKKNRKCSSTQPCCNSDIMTCVHSNADKNQLPNVGTCKDSVLVKKLNLDASDPYGFVIVDNNTTPTTNVSQKKKIKK
jgi:hypothetical protein